MQKLSARLSRISELCYPLSEEYEQFWDVCCDHAAVAFHLAHHSKAKAIFCLDQIPQIIRKVEQKKKSLEDSDIPFVDKIFCLCADATQYSFKLSHSCLLIAGVGESTAIKILERIELCPSSTIVLAIHSTNYDLREYLIERGLRLMHEEILQDKDQYYELIKLSQSVGDFPALVGDKMWNRESASYLQHKIKELEISLSYRKDERKLRQLTELRACLNKI